MNDELKLPQDIWQWLIDLGKQYADDGVVNVRAWLKEKEDAGTLSLLYQLKDGSRIKAELTVPDEAVSDKKSASFFIH